MTNIVYLRMKKNVELKAMKQLLLKDIAYVSTPSESLLRRIENHPIYRITKKDQNLVVIDSFLVIKHLIHSYKEIEIQSVGPEQTIVRVETAKANPSLLYVSLIWLILFIGTAMTIMNFHYDVSMQEVQQKLHFLFTGQENEYPLWIQIPYSLGLGAGTLLFFNYWFKKRFNEEPSPLEVEIYNYQQDLDHYLTHYENNITDSNRDT